MGQTEVFVAERPRLVGLATRILGDASEAEDVVQLAWLRLHGTDATIDNLPGWLTTVTVRLCLDRLRQRVPTPEAEVTVTETAIDPAHEVELADTVGVALQSAWPEVTPQTPMLTAIASSKLFPAAVKARVAVFGYPSRLRAPARNDTPHMIAK